MTQLQQLPDVVLKRKRLSKTKTVVIFRRNNLSFSHFVDTGKGSFVFKESFNHYGIRGNIIISIESGNLYNMFSVNTKTVKVKGGKDHLGIFLRFDDQKYLPLDKKGSVGCVKYEIHCVGKSLYYDNGKTNKKKEPVSNIYSKTYPNTTSVPSSVSWAASHPFQGGGVSPK